MTQYLNLSGVCEISKTELATINGGYSPVDGTNDDTIVVVIKPFDPKQW